MNDELNRLKIEAEEAALAAAQTAATQADIALTATGWDKHAVLVLSLSILVFGLLVLAMISYLILKKATTPIVLQAFALPLIIISAIFLVVTGYSQQQVAPVIGLLGTMAGYILGRSGKTDENQLQDKSAVATPTRAAAK